MITVLKCRVVEMGDCIPSFDHTPLCANENCALSGGVDDCEGIVTYHPAVMCQAGAEALKQMPNLLYKDCVLMTAEEYAFLLRQPNDDGSIRDEKGRRI